MKIFLTLFLPCQLFFCTSPYSDLEEVLTYYPHGWFYNGPALFKLIKKTKPKVVVELGSWLGNSTCHIAKTLGPEGKVYAVDHWFGSVEHHVPQTGVQELIPTLYEQFLSNVIHEGLTDRIIPWRMTTNQAAKKMEEEGVKIDLVYVDASHKEEDVYQDLCNWYPFVEEEGVLCGDDWSWESVRKAVLRFAEERELLVLSPSWNFWILY